MPYTWPQWWILTKFYGMHWMVANCLASVHNRGLDLQVENNGYIELVNWGQNKLFLHVNAHSICKIYGLFVQAIQVIQESSVSKTQGNLYEYQRLQVLFSHGVRLCAFVQWVLQIVQPQYTLEDSIDRWQIMALFSWLIEQEQVFFTKEEVYKFYEIEKSEFKHCVIVRKKYKNIDLMCNRYRLILFIQ